MVRTRGIVDARCGAENRVTSSVMNGREKQAGEDGVRWRRPTKTWRGPICVCDIALPKPTTAITNRRRRNWMSNCPNVARTTWQFGFLNGYNGTVRNFGFGEWHLVLGSKQQHGTPLDPTVFCTAFRIQMTLPIK